ncbi:thioredoxin-disulfide reductase [Catellicoccus marimammalium]|uniref:Thioredoxin reductase n=1 Tax=Catellicoccus marimammalium M35/04/3 TaxID=1234409 RepID=K8Z986_9ENTE|nr:thioredoxin-disulfide reductase [Catellicoccus marimammalium]EKU27440.1 Thioredoxin reductase [Catellicoccus marimammalium M35/04/3]
MKDVIVIGAGPAGMTAAMYAARAQLKVALIEPGPYGGQMNNTDVIENYPGFLSIKGMELGEKMKQNVDRDGVEAIYGRVTSIEDKGDVKLVYTEKEVYETKVVIIASGGFHRMLNIPGEEEYAGKGVSYCAVCDGMFFRNQHVVVVGGGDSAIEEGIYLSQIASKVTVVHRRDELRAKKDLQLQAFKNEKMEFIWNTVVKEVKGNDMTVTSVTLENTITGEQNDFPCDGIFIYVGMSPNTDFIKDLPLEQNHGWIPTNEKMETNIPGIYAVGDVRDKDLRQVATAVGDGTIAGQEAFQYVQSLEMNNQ